MPQVERVPLEDEDAMQRFLASNPRTLVLYWADDCTYSRAFKPHFEDAANDARQAGWTCLVRAVEHAGEGPHGERHGVKVTPTIVAYRDAQAAERLEAKILMGLSARGYRDWLTGLPR